MNTHIEGQTKVETIAGLGASVSDQAQPSMCKSTEHSSRTYNNKTKQQSAAGKLLFSERPDSHSAEQSVVSYNSKHTWSMLQQPYLCTSTLQLSASRVLHISVQRLYTALQRRPNAYILHATGCIWHIICDIIQKKGKHTDA